MAFSAFQTITAAALNRIQPAPYEATGTDYTLTTTLTDIPSATRTFSTSAANARAVITAQCDCWVTTVGAQAVIRLSVDGAMQPEDVVFDVPTASARIPGIGTWQVTLASSGSHTIKLRGYKDAGGASVLRLVASQLSIVVYEVV